MQKILGELNDSFEIARSFRELGFARYTMEYYEDAIKNLNQAMKFILRKNAEN